MTPRPVFRALRARLLWLLLAPLVVPASALALSITDNAASASSAITLAADGTTATIAVDPKDYPVVTLAANFLADDFQRVTGHRPAVVDPAHATASQLIIAGTLGHSALIDRLAAAGKIANLDALRGHWETTLTQIVERPWPGAERALVIVGSDRRGTAYGLTTLSEKIGVSPWYWWADMRIQHRDTIAVATNSAGPETDAPAVKYRGIFINDEDWGLNAWARATFDPAFGNIGPKTYEKVFELMLRLRLNYLWPAMHECSVEFGSVPENVTLADKYAIVAGSSHCEPMLYNNIHWDQKTQGAWNYYTNRDAVHARWEQYAQARHTEEAVWTLGIRGIHDAAMQTPPTALPDKLDLMNRVIQDERDLIDRYVTPEWGPVAQCFVPYKEVLPIYDAGLSLPDDVTLVWVDDNFGYTRRFSNSAERARRGGAGIYWHLSYYGSPHSYTWINTTAPALMWEELHKAWENDTRTIWIINVGDIKPMEIGIDYFARLAWTPDSFPLGAQHKALRDFAVRNFGASVAEPLADFLGEFYRLGTIRKPELMDREWVLSLPPATAWRLRLDYQDLLRREQSIATTIPAPARDAYTETIGFPARVLGSAGLIFLTDREIQLGASPATNEAEIVRLRTALEAEVVAFNQTLAGGKWNRMMPGLETGKDLPKWSSQVRWPWGEKSSTAKKPATPNRIWRAAATVDRQTASGITCWNTIEGLGPTAHAVALLPASLHSSWQADDSTAPALEYDFTISADGSVPAGTPATTDPAEAWIDFLPTFRLIPGMKLRVAVRLDGGAPIVIEVPGSSGTESEIGAIRQYAVQDNYARAHFPFPTLAAGRHTLRISAIDPGAVIDRISLP